MDKINSFPSKSFSIVCVPSGQSHVDGSHWQTSFLCAWRGVVVCEEGLGTRVWPREGISKLAHIEKNMSPEPGHREGSKGDLQDRAPLGVRRRWCPGGGVICGHSPSCLQCPPGESQLVCVPVLLEFWLKWAQVPLEQKETLPLLYMH